MRGGGGTRAEGNVAPVTKTVTNGTVTNIPGAPLKCWITRNLGADQQATSVTDNTEASAGWYWQFNRKQGFKHDGTNRTPNTGWISAITENADWLPANDPCTILLGSGWRLPTHAEWSSVDASGSWTNWSGPFNSALKLHAAGYLFFTSGSLDFRGFIGYYWSSSQSATNGAWDFYFYDNESATGPDAKPSGFSSRCLKD